MKTYTKPQGVFRLDPCRYGVSRLSFRGPRRPTDDRFIVFLGGSDTFAKYVPKPFPDLIETAVGEVCINLGCQAAGPDVYLRDTAVQALCHDAVAAVIQVTSAANQSNAFYKVHPRRNDRFIAPSPKLRALFPEVDFAEISFTGHLVSRLNAVDPDRFLVVRNHLRKVWIDRMQSLVALCDGPVFLLWFSARLPKEHADSLAAVHHPQFVTPVMMEALRSHVDDIIEVQADLGDTAGMIYPPLETLAAQEAMPVAAHIAAAKTLRMPLLHALV